MLGCFAIHRGPDNKVCELAKTPKITDLTLAYSRDGFHWHRPDRTAFLATTQKDGDWDRAYLHAAASICAVVGDRLYFYYGGWSGLSPTGDRDLYTGGATGVAFLRRDGFASMNAVGAPGSLVTRLVQFGGDYLFVNLAAPDGELRVEVLDDQGRVIEPFSAANCLPVTGDRTRQAVTWRGAGGLSSLGGRPVRFRFLLTSGSLYSFWVTPDRGGASFGYVAGGGPDFGGPMDVGG